MMYHMPSSFSSISSAIGIFDSGVGGLTVMQELIQILPYERLIYFGDTGRIPYGNKSSQTIVQYSIENTIRLLEKNIKLLVIACNTASAFALDKLRQLFRLPIVGVIEGGAKKAVIATRNKRIAVLGTRGTIESGAYQSAIYQLASDAIIFPIACPLFVPLVEEQWFNHPATGLIVQEYLHPLLMQEADTLLLGCTHYPFLRPLIQERVGERVTVVDPALTCACQVAETLYQHQLLSPTLQGRHEYYVSDDPEKFGALAERLFGYSLEAVELL